MSNDKAIAVIPKSFGEIMSMAEAFAKSTLMPDALRNKAIDIAVQIQTGQELGLPPMASIRGVNMIQGKPVLTADMMMGLVLGSGLAEYFTCTESTSATCTFVTKRKGSPHETKCTWTIEDAKRAGLHTKDNWRLHPRQMLAARAKAELARLAFPDVLAACYDPDELSVPARPVVTAEPDAVDAEVISESVAEHPLAKDMDATEAVRETARDATNSITALAAKIDAATTDADFQALIPDLKALPEGGTKQQLRERYNARRAKQSQGAA